MPTAKRLTPLGKLLSLQSTPALAVPLSRCPPCYLHMVMALVRLLWNQLVFLAEMVQEAAEELVNFLQNILGMTPDWVRVLENHEELIELLKLAQMDRAEMTRVS